MTFKVIQSKLFVKLVVLFCVLFVLVGKVGSLINPSKIEIIGPGLRPDLIVMPARYFFIYLFAAEDKRYSSYSASSLKVDIAGVNTFERECRVWINVLDRKDGSFIVRYKLYETCYNLEISVKYEGNHVGGSPFKIKWFVQPDDCYCPIPLKDWFLRNNCPASYTQIEEDLNPFPAVNFTTFHDDVVNRIDKSGSMSVCNYIILDNVIHRKCYGQHVGFKMFMDAILTSLARKMHLPDVEMFVNLGDWPLVQIGATKTFPIFSWCGSKSTLDIVMPTYDITESTLEAMGRVSLDMLSVQGSTEIPWDLREPKAFWRGRDASRHRLKLIEIARDNPDLFNASITNFFFFRDQEHIYGPKTQHVSFFKFFDYKYLVNMDGTVAAYRLPYLLAGGSLVLKQNSDYYEHFYHELKPYEHFVPVQQDLSDLVNRVLWAKKNDKEAHRIALAGQEFVRNNLLPEHIFCYHVVLINEWSKRLKEKVKLREGMEIVRQPKNDLCDCSMPLELPLHNEL